MKIPLFYYYYLLGFCLQIVSSFVVLPSSVAQAQQPLPTSSSTCLAQGSNNNDAAAATTTTTSTMSMKWFQHEITITAPSRGCHLITSQVQKTIAQDVSQINVGMMNLFIQHTSASLTINENADPDVRRDLEQALNKIVPASWNHDGTFRHTTEGDDDMPGHVKSSLMGPSLNVPIRNGRLALGTWQGKSRSFILMSLIPWPSLNILFFYLLLFQSKNMLYF
jgi:secondary thiamine-phosphate synthase enzyme